MKIYTKETKCSLKNEFFKQQFTSVTHWIRVNDDMSVDESKVYVTDKGGYHSTGWKPTSLKFDEDAALRAGYELQPSFDRLRCHASYNLLG